MQPARLLARTAWLALPASADAARSGAARRPRLATGGARLAARPGLERRARLAARAPAAGDRALPRGARRGPRDRRPCPSSARSAATSWRPPCIASTALWPSSASAAPRPTACSRPCWMRCPTPCCWSAASARWSAPTRRRRRCSVSRRSPGRSRRACAIRGCWRRSTRRWAATARPSSPCSCRGRRRAPSAS